MDGIKSKDRVKEHGEVFTPDSIVNDMLDLVDKEVNKDNMWEYIDKTYLEPSCGNGNFLIRILDRKLEIVQKLPREQWELGLVRAVASIYGVDIQSDNVSESRNRMIELIKSGSVDILELKGKEKQGFHFEKFNLTIELENVLNFILNKNIQHGNCLTGNKCVGYQDETSEPMMFTEYVWNNENVTCIGHTLQDIEINTTEDKFNNNGKFVNYMDIRTLNFEYKDTYAEDEEYDF